MSINIIPLALRKIELRGIPHKWVEETIRKPEQTVVGYGGRKIAQKIYQKNGKKMLLRVIYETEVESKSYVVITAYLTSQINRYVEAKK
jgi:hypothetical protein